MLTGLKEKSSVAWCRQRPADRESHVAVMSLGVMSQRVLGRRLSAKARTKKEGRNGSATVYILGGPPTLETRAQGKLLYCKLEEKGTWSDGLLKEAGSRNWKQADHSNRRGKKKKLIINKLTQRDG